MLDIVAPLQARSQGALRQPDGAVVWTVWAPQHKSVALATWNQGQCRLQPMQPADGYFTCRSQGVAEGLRYAYQLGDDPRRYPDPASRWQPDGVHEPSAVFFPETFAWTDGGWRGRELSELAIYELHVGTFTKEGTLEAVIPRLPALAELGITAIELMPLAQFPGQRNWGYDGVHPCAVQNSYGGPRALQRLVDAAHGAGLAVLLDVVYNHVGPEGNYLGRFGPYFTDRYHTPWGAAINFDGPDSDPVRRFVIDNARMWVRDFHLDGLRLDAVQTIFDASARHILSELQGEVQELAARLGRRVVVIAETNQNDVRLVAARSEGGYGLDGMWSDDFHHALHALLTGERDGYYADFGRPQQVAKAVSEVQVYDGCYSAFHRRRHGNRVGGRWRPRFVTCIQNHDQVGNRARGERLSALLSDAALRLAAGLSLLVPTTPLLFMGEEYGETRPFPFFCSFLDAGLIEAVRRGRREEFAALGFARPGELPDPQDPATFEQARLSWEWEGDPRRVGLRRLYADLLAARRQWLPLGDRTAARAMVCGGREGAECLVVRRGAEPGLLVCANLTPRPNDVPVPLPAGYGVCLSTAADCYGGSRLPGREIHQLQPHELVVWGPEGACPCRR